MSTNWISKSKIERDWYLIDASELILGRLSAFLASRLRGKHKSIFSPNIDCGDNFVIINANKISMSGNGKIRNGIDWDYSIVTVG